MKKRKEQIYIKQWLDLKPYDNQVPTDSYYLKLSNKVKLAIVSTEQLFELSRSLNNDEIDVLACFLTSYFEDLISESNIWNTFIKIHKKLYGKDLPFYNVDEYYEKEINLSDIFFLIWYYMNSIHQDYFISPYNSFILTVSIKVIEVFENEWEFAPENEFLKTYYSIDESENDYYNARKLIDNVLFKTYLFYPDTLFDLRKRQKESIEKNINDEHVLEYLKEIRDFKLHNSYTRLLGLKGQEWIAEILGENHNLVKEFLKISNKVIGYFFYKGQDEENVFLEHIASGKKFQLTKKSFDHSHLLKDIDTILYIGIVQWKNEWWFSGVYTQTKFNPDLVLDEKNSMQSRSTVNFLDYQNKDVDAILNKQLKAFKEFNNNQQIAFMQSDNIELFIKEFIEYYTQSLKLTQKEKKEAKQRARKEGIIGFENEAINFSEVSDSGLVFFNPKSGVEIALDVNSAFPMKNNPFYNENESENHIWCLIYDEDLSTELAKYCIDHFKNDLKYFKSDEGKLFLSNMDFLLRFLKRGNYFAKPTITFTGIEN